MVHKGMEPPRIIKKIPGMSYPFSASEWEPEDEEK